MQPAQKCIHIEHARQHNLRDISLDIPRDQLVVVCGPSGSGKSTLAFDIVYAEGPPGEAQGQGVFQSACRRGILQDR